jgi:hypothetical protein
MHAALVGITLGLLPAATVEPAQVPAQGRQAALLTMDRAGMVRLQARGGDGTACTLVDQLRGPFAWSGAAGREDCSLDVLLDVGRYKLRLASPERAKAKGQVALTARIFGELNPGPIGLSPGRPVERELPEGSQASYWFRVDRRGPVTVRVAGRTAGAVHLWRAGAWREEVTPLHLEPEPVSGQPVHEWWLQGVLEPGDYQLVAYGTAPLRHTRGEESAALTVELGFARPQERALRATIGASGAVMAATEKAPLTALLTVEGPGTGRVRLSVHPLGDDGSALQQEEGGCVVEPRAQVAECAVRVGEGRHVLLVRGPARTPVLVRWAHRRPSAAFLDGEYADAAARLPLEPLPVGDYLLGVHDVPGDPDASPLGCALERQPEGGGPWELAAWDAPRVGEGRAYQRAFNYRGRETLWFEVQERGEYTISTSGERKSTCELGRVLPGEMERLADGGPQGCSITRRLGPGLHVLQLSGGTEGVERARIALAGRQGPDSPARTSCFLRARLEAGYRYALVGSRPGRVVARGVVARLLPLGLESPFPVEVPAGETVALPLAGAGTVRVVTPGASPAGCHLAKGGVGAWRDGACWLEARGADELRLAAGPGAPLLAWVERPGRPAPAPGPAPAAFAPAGSDLPLLAVGEPARFDFEPGQQRSLVFDVAEAGLYDVGTEGLLATSCAIRTPALSGLASDRRGGRGRNCLVSAFLRPGRYLVAVRAEAPSRGRAAVALARRPARELPPAAGEGERFFRAEPGELVRQRVAIPKAGRWALTASALGAKLRCRLEDAEGWPLDKVPGPCRAAQELPAGEVIWTQLPLTVESMRRSAVARDQPALVLRGGQGRAELALWRPYAAALGKGGRDTFRFSLPAEADVSILLTDGMVGRLFREGEAEVIGLVPSTEQGTLPGPAEAGAPDAPDGGAEPGLPGGGGELEEGRAERIESAEAPDEGEGMAEGELEQAPTPPARRQAPPAPPRSGPMPGFKLHLPAGRYRLVAEHGRGDVAITYQLQVSVDPLLPGVERELAVPARVPIRVPTAGTLRIRTSGEADVRCRLFDAGGKLVAESSGVGEDWNCGLAEPVAAGDYRLEIESEVVAPGTTRLALAEPAPSEVGPLADGQRLALAGGGLSGTLPQPTGDALLDVGLEGPVPFSCALEDEAGRLVSRSGPATACRFLLLPAGKGYRLRAWTLDRSTEVTARLRARPVADPAAARLAEGGTGRARVARPGTYRTADGVHCLAGASGLLEPCGPEVSLEAGPVVLAAAARGFALEERIAELGAGEEVGVAAGPRTRIERQRSAAVGTHLVAVTVPPGERTVPTCRIEGGVHVATAGGCFAASSPGRESLLRLRAGEPVAARAWRAAVTRPVRVELPAGGHRIEIAPEGTLLTLPGGPVRAELTLPPGAWAVLQAGGAAADLCAPGPALARCTLAAAEAAEVLLFAPAERRAEAVVTRLPAPPAARDLTGLHEGVALLPGSQRWRLPAASAERFVRVEGATACAVALDDGARLSSCELAIPAGIAGTLVVEHRAGPLRLLAAPRGDGLALAGGPLPEGAPRRLEPGEALPLQGALVDRTLELPGEAVVRVRAERGVCLLVSGGKLVASGGMGEGCRIDRLLGKGTHRLVVRAFGSEPLTGAVGWSSSLVERLAEGVGAERWVAPGDARVFRFTLAAQGRVGIGLREEAETAECTVTDEAGRTLGEGCQQLLALDPGSYLLAVRAPPGAAPSRIRPVLLGLAGAEVGVPEAYLRDLFQRIGGTK